MLHLPLVNVPESLGGLRQGPLEGMSLHVHCQFVLAAKAGVKYR